MTRALAAMNRRIDMVIIHSWTSFQETFEARASEWTLAAITVTLAIVTMLNDQLFDIYIYNSLKAMLSQNTWALIFLIVGTLRIVVLIINGAYWRTPHFRCALAFVNCFLWFQLSIGLAPNMGWGLAIFPWMFLLDAYNALRVAREVGVVQGLRTEKRQKADAEPDR